MCQSVWIMIMMEDTEQSIFVLWNNESTMKYRMQSKTTAKSNKIGVGNLSFVIHSTIVAFVVKAMEWISPHCNNNKMKKNENMNAACIPHGSAAFSTNIRQNKRINLMCLFTEREPSIFLLKNVLTLSYDLYELIAIKRITAIVVSWNEPRFFTFSFSDLTALRRPPTRTIR